VEFKKRLDENKDGVALVWEGVRVLTLPGEDPNQVPDIDKALAAELPEGALYLTCDRLKVVGTREGRPALQLEAYGRVYSQAPGMYARAEMAFWGEANKLLVLRGSATLCKLHGSGKPEEIRGAKIQYSQASGCVLLNRDEITGPNPSAR
jgi:hypothetical protein